MLEITRVTPEELHGLLTDQEWRLWKNLDHGVKEDRLIITKEGGVVPIKVTRGKASTKFNLYDEGYQKLSHEEAMECTEVHTHPPMTGELMSWVNPMVVDIFSDIDLESIADRERKIPHKMLMPPGKIERVIAKRYIYTMERVGSVWPREFACASYDIGGRIGAIREHLLAREDLDRLDMTNNSGTVGMIMEAQATWDFLTELARANKINLVVWELV